MHDKLEHNTLYLPRRENCD